MPAVPVLTAPDRAVEMTEQQAEKKQRVYELARELNISSEALIKVLTDMNVAVKSHMSTLTEDQRKGVVARFEKEKQEARDRATTKSRKRKKRRKKAVVSAEAVKAVRDTVAQLGSNVARSQKKRRRRYREEKQERHEKLSLTDEDEILKVTEFTSPSELAELMDIPLNEVIAKCLELGLMTTANQRLDADTLALVAA